MKSLLPIAIDNASVMQAFMADLSFYWPVIGGIMLSVMIFKRRLSYRHENASFPDGVDADEVEALSGS